MTQEPDPISSHQVVPHALATELKVRHPLMEDVKQTVVMERQVLPSEPQEGNIEYKLKLIDPSAERLVHLTTQMKWRLAEGGGEAIYQIGVGDDGSLHGLSVADLEASLETLATIAHGVGATFTLLRRSPSLDGHGVIAEVHVRKATEDQQFVDVRVFVLGDSGSGKSTVIACLASGKADNGRGSARLDLFRHSHEVVTGRTASTSTEMLAFDGQGNVLNYDKDLNPQPVADICSQASKVVHLIDSPGLEKYEKTTLSGLARHGPDHICIVVSATRGMTSQTKRHMDMALALNIPVFVVITKIDKCRKDQLKHALVDVCIAVKSPGSNKVPQPVKNVDDLLTARDQGISVVPIFFVSNVTGKNLNLLSQFMNLLPCVNSIRLETKSHLPAKMLVEDTFNVSGVGAVVAGMVRQGLVRTNDRLMLGPQADGSFAPVTVTSIHRNRAPVSCVKAGQVASVAVSGARIRRGQILCEEELIPPTCQQFDADLLVIDCPAKQTLTTGFPCSVFVQNVRQSGVIEHLGVDDDGAVVCATVRFEHQPEVVEVGSRVVLHSGYFKAIGSVTSTTPPTAERTAADATAASSQHM
ncbi:hypothetical protein PTSG_11779 [Salpingoeca rosetta]|uniref:Uncharacterized protein n=1 Tax=Salpingoeca rosetta (strain ATCC 50818 / BSB-021) TaxID=946362 RepID=F2TYU0_SALR5|nr:uncharacterized protein PTSG_11779 [Salpingoeca rosetta]EGD78764.1 hypothetical protein PTSG_11779 [Salpingoeca rosetta]|eukprot:XP_004997720.1 hypothetical protein PTSG_11779 [Salpingoeca rosetta]